MNKFLLSLSREQLSNWNKYTINGEIVMDFVGLYENLEDDLTIISKKLNLPNLNLPETKNKARVNHEHYSRVLSSETRAHIENLCALEIACFGYHWAEA